MSNERNDRLKVEQAANLLRIGALGERMDLTKYVRDNASRLAGMTGKGVALDILAWVDERNVRAGRRPTPGAIPTGTHDGQTGPMERDEAVEAIRHADKGTPAGRPTLKLATVSDQEGSHG